MALILIACERFGVIRDAFIKAGHDASKDTGLALKNLPDLIPTSHVEPRWVYREGKKPLPRWGNQTDSGQNKLTPGEGRAMERARTYQGWADAMVNQWGPLL